MKTVNRRYCLDGIVRIMCKTQQDAIIKGSVQFNWQEEKFRSCFGEVFTQCKWKQYCPYCSQKLCILHKHLI